MNTITWKCLRICYCRPLSKRSCVLSISNTRPAHVTLIIREFINLYFSDRSIGQHGPIHWPVRLPDLTGVDLFLWGHLRQKMYMAAMEKWITLFKNPCPYLLSMSVHTYVCTYLHITQLRCGQNLVSRCSVYIAYQAKIAAWDENVVM